MRRLPPLTLLAVLVMFGARLTAQQVTLPELTDQQRWERLASNTLAWQAAVVALGEAQGLTPEETGKFVGEFFSQGWLGGAEAGQLLVGFYRNFMGFPGAKVEILSQTPTSVTARFNHPLEAQLGAGRRSNGVPFAKIRAMGAAIDEAIADWVSVDLKRTADGDHDVLTFTTEYGPLVAGDDIRWARGSYFDLLSGIQLLALKKAKGLSAREIGESDAKLFAPTWTARTPWQLVRGMIWNQMSNMNAECEILSASPDEVRARCREFYRDMVLAQRQRFDVTPEDFFESGRAFAMGVADHLGMRWQETLENGWRMITVTRK